MADVALHRIKEVFGAALELDPVARVAYLDDACGNDADLRRKVERMLAAHDSELLNGPTQPDATLQHAGESVGDTIDRYRLLERIGTGGFGDVYMAEQREPIRRKVALKLTKLGMDTRQVVARFEAERQALALMDHSGIARVFDAGATATGRPYFVMELVRGVPITRFCVDTALDLAARLDLFMQVCAAVQHAHHKGIVHRDLKPSNVLVTLNDGTPAPKVIDFGIAKALHHELTEKTLFTEYRQFVGTPEYMSPEQAATSGIDVDTRSDVYSLGVLLYELLTGVTPFDPRALRESPVAEIQRIITEVDPPRPSTRLSELATTTDDPERLYAMRSLSRRLTGDLDWIVMKALEKDRRRRYVTAAALAQDVRRHLEDQPIAARPVSPLYQFRKFVRRYKTLVRAVAVAFAAMFVGAVLAVWQMQVARLARLDAEFESYLSTIRGASAAIGAADAATARALLESADPRFRNWEWEHLHARLDSSLVAIAPDETLAGVAFDRDRAAVLTLSRDGQLRRWDADTGRLVSAQTLEGRSIEHAAFAADGSTVAAVHGGGALEVSLWDTASGRAVRTFEPLEHAGRAVAIAPDGRFVAVETEQGIRQWSMDGEERGSPVESPSAWHRSLVALQACSTDGRFAVADRKRIELHRSEADRSPTVLTGHTSTISGVAFSADASMLASGDERIVRVWDLTTRQSMALTGHTDRVRHVSFSPDASRVVSWSDDGSVRIWLAADPDPTTVLRGHTSWCYAVDFSPEGSRLLSGGWDGTVRVWDAAGGEQLAALETALPSVEDAVCTPDGRFIAAAAGGSLYLWDAVTGALLRTWRPNLRLTPEARESRSYLDAGREGLAVSRPEGHTSIWQLPDDRDPVHVHPVGVDAIAVLSSDGRHVAVAERTSVAVADAATGEVVRRWPVPKRNNYSDAEWSPDGTILATAHVDHTIRFWSPETGTLLAVLDGHSAPVYGLAFSPDGTRLASGAEDTTIRLWDVARQRAIIELRGHEEYVFSVAFSPDGSRLASASGDQTIRIWDTRPVRERWLARQRMRVLREETAPLVDRLIEQLADQTAVAEQLSSSSALGPEEQAAALQVVLQRPAPRADDVNGNGVPDEFEDCNRNGVLDDADIAARISEDRDGNGVPDECERRFAAEVADSTGGWHLSASTGPPDGAAADTGAGHVTLDLGGPIGLDQEGPDLNVYEGPHGRSSFHAVDILVSLDGVRFVSVKASEGPWVRVPGDPPYADGFFARSYDLAATGLGAVRFVRVDGRRTGFSLDAVGVVHLGATFDD